MNDKEKYLELMQRYYDAETSPEEERDLARYAASTDDPAFEQLRGVLGFLSIGRRKKARKGRAFRLYAAAASVALVAAVGLGLSAGRQPAADGCVRYAYGEKVEDDKLIMESVETSLAEFFGEKSPAETNLLEMFKR